MATYSLLFGHAEWPEDGDRGRHEAPPHPDEGLTLEVPSRLRGLVEASAALEGVPTETWIVRALRRSVDPRVAA